MKTLVIFAKYPAPGKVKTRLGAQIGYQLAADLYELFIEKTLGVASRCGADQILIAYEPVERAEDFKEILPAGTKVFAQCGFDLGDRMYNAFQHVLSEGALSTVIIGSDSPTLPTQFIDAAFEKLQLYDLVVGPADDGGYYLIGANLAHQGIFSEMEWSAPTVLSNTLERANELRLSNYLLPKWYDVDDVESLKRAASDDPDGEISDLLERHSILTDQK
jgi:hypothetical protein